MTGAFIPWSTDSEERLPSTGLQPNLGLKVPFSMPAKLLPAFFAAASIVLATPPPGASAGHTHVTAVGTGGLSPRAAMITPADGQVNIFRWNHRRLPAHVRCWTDPDEIMFLRTLHQSNDSDRSVPGSAKPLDSHEVRAMLQARFGIDPDAAWALMEPDQLAARP